MKFDIKQEWLQALRSEEYLQGRCYLRTSEKHFCCLGVLCDLHSKKTGHEWNLYEGMYLGSYISPPDDILKWADISDEVSRELMRMNDQGKKTFNEIANWIEENL